MVFVTLGSQKFQFDRLLKKIDTLIVNGLIKEKVVAQIGASIYIPQHYEYLRFMDRSQFSSTIDKCDCVITHGGTGVIIGAVKKKKKVIAVPRLAKFGEHVDNHQLQLLHQFDELGIICACYDVEDLGNYYQKLGEMEFRPYISNTQNIIESLDSYLQKISCKDRGKER